jgi:carboxylesterase
MIEWIIGIFALLSLYNEATFFFIKRRVKNLEVKVIKEREPFFIKKGKKGVLLIHGYSCSAGEMRELGNYLAEKGFTVHAPLLTGHGTSPERMSVVKWYQWIDCIKHAIDLLNEHCDEIWLVGNSMGGNLAIITNDYNIKIKGIICLGTPFYYASKFKWAKLIFPLIKRIKFMQKKSMPKNRYVRGKKIKYSYLEIPLRSVPHLVKVIKVSKKKLKDVKKDIFVMQARPDNYLSEKSASFIIETVGSKRKKLLWMENFSHVVLNDPKRARVFKEIFNFIK